MKRTLLALTFATIAALALAAAAWRGAPFDAADRLGALWLGGACLAACAVALRPEGR